MIQRKRTFGLLWVGVLGLLAPAATWTTTATAQTIVVTARSVKDLAGDFEYLIKAAAPQGMNVQAAVDALNQLRSGEMVKGLDQARGFGLAITLPKDFPAGGVPPTVVVAVPVTDLGQFLTSLGNLGIAVDDKPGVEGFSHKVSGPNDNPTLFVVQAKGYALFTPFPVDADKLKAVDPSSWKAKGRPEAALSARVQLSEIPDALKEQFVAQLEAQSQPEERKPGEDEAEFKGRVAGARVAMDALKSLVRDGDALSLALDVDRKAGELALDLSLSARPGSDMAKSMRSLGGRRSRFQELAKDGSLAFWASFPVAKEFREGIVQGIDASTKAGLDKVTTDAQKKLFTRFVDLLKANIGASEFDYGIAFGRQEKDGKKAPHFSIVFGMKVQDGRAFDKLIRDAIEQEKPDKGMKVEFDVAKAGDGTGIHRLSGPFNEKDPKEANMLKTFGKGSSLAFAFRDDAIFLVFGEESVAAVRSAVEGYAANRPAAAGPGAPIAGVVRLADFGVFADDEGARESFRRASEAAFGGDAAKKDRFSVVLKGEGDGVRLRVSLDVPAMKYLATVGQSMKK